MATEITLKSGSDVQIISFDPVVRTVTVKVKANASEVGKLSESLTFQAKVASLVSNDSIKSVQISATKQYRVKQSFGGAEDIAGSIAATMGADFTASVDAQPEFTALIKANAILEWTKSFEAPPNTYPSTLALRAAVEAGIASFPQDMNSSVPVNATYSFTYTTTITQNELVVVTGTAGISGLFSSSAQNTPTKASLGVSAEWPLNKQKVTLKGELNTTWPQGIPTPSSAKGTIGGLLQLIWSFP